MCWPQGKAERKFAGVTHIDVTSLSNGRVDEIHGLCAKYGVSLSGLGYYPNPWIPALRSPKNPWITLRK